MLRVPATFFLVASVTATTALAELPRDVLIAAETLGERMAEAEHCGLSLNITAFMEEVRRQSAGHEVEFEDVFMKRADYEKSQMEKFHPMPADYFCEVSAGRLSDLGILDQ